MEAIHAPIRGSQVDDGGGSWANSCHFVHPLLLL